MSETTKIYVGSAKEVETQFGSILKIAMSKSDVEKLQENLNGKGWVNLKAQKRKEADKYGNTHFLIVDNYNR